MSKIPPELEAEMTPAVKAAYRRFNLSSMNSSCIEGIALVAESPLKPSFPTEFLQGNAALS